MYIFFMLGAANANTHTPVCLAHMPVNISQPVMPAMPAALFHSDAACIQINFIMKDDDVFGRDFVKSGPFRNCKSGFIHKGLWFQKDDFLGANPALTAMAGGFLFPAAALT